MKRLFDRWVVALLFTLVAACGDASPVAPPIPTEARTSQSANTSLAPMPEDGYVDGIHCPNCLTEIVVAACEPGYYRDEITDRCVPYNSGGQVGGTGGGGGGSDGWGDGGGGSSGGASDSDDGPLACVAALSSMALVQQQIDLAAQAYELAVSANQIAQTALDDYQAYLQRKGDSAITIAEWTHLQGLVTARDHAKQAMDLAYDTLQNTKWLGVAAGAAVALACTVPSW